MPSSNFKKHNSDTACFLSCNSKHNTFCHLPLFEVILAEDTSLLLKNYEMNNKTLMYLSNLFL